MTGSLWHRALLGAASASLIVALLGQAPLSALAQSAVLGSLSAVGPVQLRGVLVADEGTLFDGDRIQTSGEAYVQVHLLNGPQLELGSNTAVALDRGDRAYEVEMNQGRMAFSTAGSSVPLTISVRSVAIEAPQGAAAQVAFLAPNRVSVTVLTESLRVTETTLQETEQVEEGEQVIIDLDQGLAPADVPAEGDESAAGDEQGGSSGKWVAVGAGVGGGAGAVAFLVKKDKSPASRN